MKNIQKEFPGSFTVGTNVEYNYLWIHSDFVQLRSKADVRRVAKGLEDAAKFMRKQIKTNKVISK